MAKAYRLKNADQQSWRQLTDSSERLPNLADRAFVLSDLGRSLPHKFHQLATELFEKSKTIVSELPSVIDRLVEFEHLAICAGSSDNAIAKQCIKLAMNGVKLTVDPELIPPQRRLIDLAYRLDPEFAGSLVSTLDTDPAREDRRTRLLQRDLRALEARKKLIDASGSCDEGQMSPNTLSKEASRMLGKMHSGRASTMSLDAVRNRLECVSHLPFHRSYPALAWIVESAVQRFSSTEQQARAELMPMYEAIVVASALCVRFATNASGIHDGIRRFAGCSKVSMAFPIGPGRRSDAFAYIQAWLQENLRDYAKICDPFFGPEELDVLRMILLTGTICNVSVLTSARHQHQSAVTQPWDQAYRNHWRTRVSDQEPPETDLVIVGTKGGGDLPIHDRWILTRGSGLRLGSSLNSIGKTRHSEISVLSADEAQELENIVDAYLMRQKRDHEGERLQYTIFNLS